MFTPMRWVAFSRPAAIVLAACGGGGGKTAAGNDMAGMDMAAEMAGQREPSAPVATDAVAYQELRVLAGSVTVKAGSTVVWTNDDSIQHDVTFDSGGIASSDLNHNDTFSHTFLTAGTYHYICSIHPFMHGTVIVTA